MTHVADVWCCFKYVLCVAAQEFGVETEVVQADFMDGRPIYEDIAKHLQDKDIGILGKFFFKLLPSVIIY